MRRLAGILISLLLPGTARAATLHVPGGYPTIQAALTAAAFGDTVLVASGTYTGDDNKNLEFQGRSIVLQADGAVTIDCEGSGRGFLFQGETIAAVVDGFRIANGSATGNFPESWGGGILCIGAAPTIRNCMVSNCSAAHYGGGIALYDSSPILTGCTVAASDAFIGAGLYCHGGSDPTVTGSQLSGNSATFGGGIACGVSSAPSLTECVLLGNDATTAGGGFYSDASSAPQLFACQFRQNVAPEGGGIYIGGGAPGFHGCTIETNSAARGGGAYSSQGSPHFDSCTFRGNTASTFGGGGYLFCCDTASPVVERCAFIDNHASSGGALASRDVSPAIRQSLFKGNVADSQGGGFYSDTGGTPTIEGCTFYANLAASGSSIAVGGTAGPSPITRTIMSFSQYGQAVSCFAGGGVALSCCDIYANLGGDWVGCIADQAGTNGNFSLNPLFCGADVLDFTLREQSPCAPGNSPPGCGLIGSQPVGCGVTAVGEAVVPTTWGALKSLFR